MIVYEFQLIKDGEVVGHERHVPGYECGYGHQPTCIEHRSVDSLSWECIRIATPIPYDSKELQWEGRDKIYQEGFSAGFDEGEQSNQEI